jgi:hypothetical protein
MKVLTTTFALLALLALVPCAQAQTPPAAAAGNSLNIPAPVSVAEFLDTLQTPAPTPMATACSSSTDCPKGQLCCYPCGIDGCTPVCTRPLNGSCPRYP